LHGLKRHQLVGCAGVKKTSIAVSREAQRQRAQDGVVVGVSEAFVATVSLECDVAAPLASSEPLPVAEMGWGRPPPRATAKRFHPDAFGYLMQCFMAGQQSCAMWVKSDVVCVQLREKFPGNKECHLSEAQIKG